MDRHTQILQVQVRFRAYNEFAEELAGRVARLLGNPTAPAQAQLNILCECANAHCFERLELEAGEYEQVRTDPRQFVVRAGHEVEAVEEIAAVGDGCLVVRKRM
jgi:hypothetical protein